MKKRIFIAILVLALCLTVLAACKKPVEDNMPKAKEYVTNLYKNEPTSTEANYKRVTLVKIGEDSFTVSWAITGTTTAAKIGATENNQVTIEIERQEEDVPYTLTATISDGKDKTETISYNYTVPKKDSQPPIITDDGLEKAKSFVQSLYRDAPTTYAVNFKRVAQVVISGVTYPVTWTIENGGTAAVVGEVKDGQVEIIIDGESQEKVEYILTATISDANGKTETLTYNYTVPKSELSTYEQYKAACEAGSEDTIQIKAYIIGVVSTTSGSKGSMYLQDADGHGYYAYGPALDNADLKDDATLREAWPVGTEVIVTGTGTVYGGQYEFNKGCTVRKTGKTATAEEIPYLDATEAFGSAANSKDTSLIPLQNRRVTLNNCELSSISSDGKYYYFKVNGVQFNVYNTNYFMDGDLVKELLAKFEIGKVATISGIVSCYSNSYQIYPDSMESISNVHELQRSDEEKVAFELENLTMATKVIKDSTIELAANGEIETDVQFAWSIKEGTTAPAATIDGNNLVVKLQNEPSEINLVVTATCGEASATREFVIDVAASEIEWKDAAWAIEECAKLNGDEKETSEDWYFIYGTIIDDPTEDYCNFSISSDGGATSILVYGLATEDGSQRYGSKRQIPEIPVKKGDVVYLYGQLQNYNGKLEIVGTARLQPAPDVQPGSGLIFDFSAITETGTEITEGALDLFNDATQGASGLTNVTVSKVYKGTGSGGAHPDQGGLLKLGTGKAQGQIVLTFAEGTKVVKVELVCHDFYKMSEQYPTNSNKISVNGCEAVLAPYNADGTMEKVSFEFATASNVITIDTNNRIYIEKIIITLEDGGQLPDDPCKDGHTEETLPAVAATCTETGLTEGTKCSVCGKTLKAQETVPALGHTYVDGVCTVCGATEPGPIDPTLGTAENPFTVEGLLAAFANLENKAYSENIVYVRGIMVGGEGYNAQFKNYTFDIGDTADATNLVTVFRVKNADAIPVAVGDTVLVAGYVQNYNGTIEVCNKDSNGGVLVSVTKPDQPKTDAEKVAAELEQLTMPETIASYMRIALPANGAAHEDVALVWDIKVGTYSPTAIIINDELVVNPYDKEDKINLVVTATCGEAIDTKEFVINVLAHIDGVIFNFSTITETAGKEITAEDALNLFNGWATSESGLTAVTVSKVYPGTGSGGAHPNEAGLLKLGTKDVAGKIVLTFAEGTKIAKVEIVCHDFYAKSDDHPTNSNTIAVNGCEPVLAPYNADGALEKLVFELTATSNVITIDTNKRVYISQILVYYGEVGSDLPEDPCKDGHTEETLPAVAATCTEPGKTEGTKCSVCGKTLTAQEVVPALGHNFVDGKCTVCNEPDPSVAAPLPGETIETALTVADVWTNYDSLADKAYSDKQLYVKGVVVTAPTINASYGSYTFFIADAADLGGKQVQAFSLNLSEGVTTVCMNDEVILFGYIQKYGTKLEVAYKDGTGKIVERTAGTSSISYTANENAEFGASNPISGTNGSEFTFTVTAKTGFEISAVKVNGTAVEANADGSYTGIIAGNTVVTVETKQAGAADPVVIATLNFGPGISADSEKVGSYTAEYTATRNGIDFTITNFNNNQNGWSYIKAGRKAQTGETATISTTISNALSKVVLNIGDLANGNAKVKLEVIQNGSVIASEEQDVAKGEMTFNIASPAENCTYRLTFTCNNTTTKKNGVVSLTSVTYWA